MLLLKFRQPFPSAKELWSTESSDFIVEVTWIPELVNEFIACVNKLVEINYLAFRRQTDVGISLFVEKIIGVHHL